jgi:hypothetical protein
MTTLHCKTSMGVPVRIEIDDWQISAYREEEAQVLKREYHADGSVHIETEPELSRYLTREAVMTIRKCWTPGDFVVDFEAGLSRGRITVGQQQLTTRCSWPSSGPGYLRWIGLSWKDAEVRAWLKANSIMTAALAKAEADGGRGR